MPIRRKGRGWEVRLQHAGKRLSRTFQSRSDAAEFERRTRNRIADHRVGRSPTYTLEEALHRWLTGEAASLKSYRKIVNAVRAIYPNVKGRSLGDLADVAEGVIKGAHGLQPATINRRLAILRRVGRLAYRKWRWLDRDEASRITLLPGEEARHVQATPQQAEALLRAATGRTREAIRWAIGTGLRAGELRNLRPENFRDGAIVLTKTKTGKPRIVPLQRGLDSAKFPYDLTDGEIRRSFREARSKAGMPWLQFRDLRRTFGSWVVQKTGSLAMAQDLLGHTTPVITRRHYAHLLEGNLRRAVNRIPNVAGMARGRRK